MKRFFALTLSVALLVGLASAKLRLGDSCNDSNECNSGCCWYGVCRDSFENCSSESQNEALKMYKVAVNGQKAKAMTSKLS
jgi:hypothetical protein